MTSAVPVQPSICNVKVTWLPLTKQTPVRSDLKPRQKERLLGRAHHASTRRSSPSTCTDRERTGHRAGPRRTAPDVTSNLLPWQGQVTVVPSSFPVASEHPACVRV